MILFQNPGILSPDFFSTFGVSVKSHDNAIGFFGTGLKYAIAILLREGIHFRIQSGESTYTFGTEVFQAGGKAFTRCMYAVDGGDPLPLPFTTDLGRNWELWQAYRELFCNCIDEGGDVMEEAGDAADFCPHQKDWTTIAVFGRPFAEVHANRFGDVIHPGWGKDPLVASAVVQVYPGRTQYIYYQGIRVGRASKMLSFTYNLLTGVMLTEDRTLASEYGTLRQIERFWLEQCTDVPLLKQIVEASDDTIEGSFDGQLMVPTADFIELIREKMKRKERFNMKFLNLCRAAFIKDYLETSDEMTPVEEKQLIKAKDFLKRHGYSIDMYPIKFFAKLSDGDNCLGQALENTILLSRRAFQQGTKQLASTLLEEYFHLSLKFRDETREFQNFLFDRLISAYEDKDGEPL